ncbi:MAG: prolipoprotein diacylglyceryl transferase [Planctomycetota bacterium]|nr:prolipoprotein diacylglyceryl transferase [Planctomycetota bacterium]
MQQTLFTIDHEIGPLPIFGFGWLLIIWCLYSGIWITRYYTSKTREDSAAPWIPIVAVALLIAVVLPFVEPVDSDGPTGLQIRGYGVMVLLGVVSGLGLLSFLAKRQGLHPDFAMSLILFLFIPGILGGRCWYVIQKWSNFAVFHRDASVDWQVTVPKILKFTEGGLVVYGALIGSLIGCLIFITRRKLPRLATLDLVVPAMMAGMFFGRLGCFMNGCCFGGLCDAHPLGVTFPAGSPPYMQHVDQGFMFDQPLANRWGLTANISPRQKGYWIVEVKTIAQPSVAQDAGLVEGQALMISPRLNDGALAEYLRKGLVREDAFLLRDATSQRLIGSIGIGDMPPRSRHIYPTQLLSSITAGLICLFLLAYYPYRRHDGQVLAMFLTLYGCARFLLEWVRNDELGQLQTSLTISQLGSIVAVTIAVLLWLYTTKNKKPLAYPIK